jgi:DNA-binding GntR family transcriptional regulator
VLGHFVVREALEVQAAMMFAARSTSGEKAELRKIAGRLDACGSEEGEPLVWRTMHEELHLRIAACGRCGALSEVLGRSSALASAWAGAMRATTPEHPAGHHSELARILATKCPATAGEVMRAHIRANMDQVMLSLEPWFQRQKHYKYAFSRTLRKNMELALQM